MVKLFFERSVFSLWRLIPIAVIMFSMSAMDLYYFETPGVDTTGELIGRTILFTISGYIGFTIAAYAVSPTGE